MSSLWGSILRVGGESHSFGVKCHKGLGFWVGEGNIVHFWVDDWFRVGPLLRVYSRLFGLVCNKLLSIKYYYIGEGSVLS